MADSWIGRQSGWEGGGAVGSQTRRERHRPDGSGEWVAGGILAAEAETRQERKGAGDAVGADADTRREQWRGSDKPDNGA